MSNSKPELTSCGFLIFRDQPSLSFLLMKHPDRWDLPKGHVDPGETEMECALRELEEETGIRYDQFQVIPGFRFSHFYTVKYKRHGNIPKRKELIIFLGKLNCETKLNLTEHESFQWFPWKPPHKIQEQTIDPLLAEVEEFIAATTPFSPH